MATIDSKVLFITTSPRTPSKMIPEIELLAREFSGEVWNADSQSRFMELLREENFFNGEGNNDPAFSARDRINRAPKAFGFVTLSPVINLTEAGRELVTADRKEEIFLRQLLKFQVPSPFHKPTKNAAHFWVKPYLELFRLIRYFGSLKFDELMIFGLQLVDYRKFDEIVNKIEEFRRKKIEYVGNYKQFKIDYLNSELRKIYHDEIASGNTRTRESRSFSVSDFLTTKSNNLRDYADACYRYLRATGLVNISYYGKSISIIPEKLNEVDFFLKNTERDPCFVDNEQRYVNYLSNASLPQLITDDRDYLLKRVEKDYPHLEIAHDLPVTELKKTLFNEIENIKTQIITNQISELKDYRYFDDIEEIFDKIVKKDIYDPSLMLEWNAWRAMTMLDGGNITANLKFDDFGNPMSTALGNMADIFCDYGDFGLTVEVTLQTGQRQYEMEGEPVSRHLAKFKKETNKTAYCLFIAPTINPSSIAHFYILHKTNIDYYGGTSVIVPMQLDVFRKMLSDSYKADFVPSPNNIKRFFERSVELAETCSNEAEWYSSITQDAMNWLNC